ncbi:MAG: hypothetical protein ACRCUT_05095 [Spirochaetota bacterium]
MNPEEYPIIYIHERFLFPRCSIEIPVKARGRKELSPGDTVVVYTFGSFRGLICAGGRVATLGTVSRLISGKGESMAEIRGEKRIRILSRKKIMTARCADIPHKLPEVHEDLSERLRKKAQEFVFLINIPESDRLIYLVNFIQGLSDISDFIAHYFIIDQIKKRVLYNEADPGLRGDLLEKYLDLMIDDLKKANERP